MAGGRPTNYEDDMPAKVLDYLENYKEYGDVVPIAMSLCKVLGRANSTIHEWAKDPTKPEFSDAFKQVKEYQHVALVNGGLDGKMSTPIVKMMMTNHGYSDKSEVKQEITADVKQEISATDNFAAILSDYKKD